MPRFRFPLAFAVASALALLGASQASAAAVLSVLTVRVEGDPAAWLALVKQAAAIRTKLGLPTPSVSQATFAGGATGLFFVSFEYPSLAALEEANAKASADPAWPALLNELNAAGSVESSSLYVDRTPAGAEPTPMTPGGYAVGIIVRAPDAAAYLALLPSLAANSERLGSPIGSVWQATAAGDATGSILIRTAYPSLASIETAQAKLDGDAQARQMMRDFEATGRKVVSRLIARDRTPR